MMKGAVLCHDQITGTLIKARVKIDMINDGIETNRLGHQTGRPHPIALGGNLYTPMRTYMLQSFLHFYAEISVVRFFSRYKIDMID